MQVVTSHDPGPLSNSYLVYDHEGGAALLVDGGTPTARVHGEVRARGLRPELLVVTHRHPDHIAHVSEYAARYGIPVAGHPAEAEACGGFDRLLSGGEALAVGDLEVTPLHVPGHTAGHLAVLVRHGEERVVFTGDTLFAGSVGGTRGPGHTSLADLRRSVLEVLLALPPDTLVYPGHTVPTTVADERAGNAFVRAWSGEELPAPRPCLVTGAPATLLLRAPDYDGGTKCWVRWPDGGEDVVPGSRVREA